MKVNVFEKEQTTRELLSHLLGKLGHQANFPDPAVCPLYSGNSRLCPQRKPCADVIISNPHMPKMKASDLFDQQQKFGCKMLESNKLILNDEFVDLKRSANVVRYKGHDYVSMPLEIIELKLFLLGCDLRTRRERYWLH